MGVITALLIVVFVIAAVFLVIVILLQDEQGEGLGGIFGGGSGTPFGSRSGNILTKTTSVLAAIFLFCSFAIAWMDRTPQSGDVVGAAKREQAKGGTEWWLAPVSNDATLPTAATSGTGAATTGSPQAPSGNAPAPLGAVPPAPSVPAAPQGGAPTSQGGGGSQSLAQ